MMRAGFCLGILIVLLISHSSGQQPVPAVSRALSLSPDLKSFLENDGELRRIYGCRFTGTVFDIPPRIEEQLLTAFPHLRFLIVEMEVFTDLPWKRTKLILITQKDQEGVKAFVWEGMWAMPSRSFKRLLYGQKVNSSQAVLQKVTAFAELLAHTGPLKVGPGTANKKTVEVELLLRESDSRFRTLQLKIGKGNVLREFNILRQDGRRIS